MSTLLYPSMPMCQDRDPTTVQKFMGGATTCWQVFRPPSDLRLADFVFDDPHFHECVFDKHKAIIPNQLYWRNFPLPVLIGILPKKAAAVQSADHPLMPSAALFSTRIILAESFLMNQS